MSIVKCFDRRPVVAAAIAVIALAVVPSACRRHRRVTVQTTEEAPVLASVVATADPHVASQLAGGFYGIEQNSWRWTAGRFSVLLRPPHSAVTSGATLQLKFAIPDVTFAKLGTVSLSCYVNGTAQPPETYTKAGQYTYTRDVPANLVTGEVARVDFSLDKTIPASPSDRRELGVVVSMIGLQPR